MLPTRTLFPTWRCSKVGREEAGSGEKARPSKARLPAQTSRDGQIFTAWTITQRTTVRPCYRVNFRTKSGSRTGGGGGFTLINRPLNQEAIRVLNMYAQNTSASKPNGTAKDRDRKARRQIYGDCWKSQHFTQQSTGHSKSVRTEKIPTIAPINLT